MHLDKKLKIQKIQIHGNLQFNNRSLAAGRVADLDDMIRPLTHCHHEEQATTRLERFKPTGCRMPRQAGPVLDYNMLVWG
jgi:hypothetical protein